MMFKRKIYDTMLDWKRQSCGLPLYMAMFL